MVQQKNNVRKQVRKEQDGGKMAISERGLRLLLVGLVVMVSGFILLAGGKSDNPDFFNWEMFNFTRMVAAPILIIAGIVIEIVGIMGRPRIKQND
ncbi:hypothetical protein B5F83_09135 [Muribaculum sp. An289]|uniref:DUF3098 domain-containing protein n=1 Tax=Candidatus Merdivivens faecigallinarum TaxID=2840871 RepID=A0A9D9J159_9BACT|nr:MULTISPECIES: DUF3098 domain-containing protein [unclassified Muribaculum]MBO8482303.1 DUF3098 domain-containing protein [Candidatus Merdivivens faecigallinarum]OUO36280.1 hypothetical protein B5F83_09135 [Muribaculum sp. An289]OUO41886.1 hypothetical protein B5F81_09095 [Muribaculum sp. An287]